jgi:hypothetical protein
MSIGRGFVSRPRAGRPLTFTPPGRCYATDKRHGLILNPRVGMAALVHISFGESRAIDRPSGLPMSDTARGSIYHDAARQRVADQRRLADALDSKTAPILAFASAILPAFGALLTLSGKPVPSEVFAIYGIAFAVYITLALRVRQATRVRAWHVRPDLAVLRS